MDLIRLDAGPRPLITRHVRLGLQPFQKAMAEKFPDQRTMFVSWNRPNDLRTLSGLLVGTLGSFLCSGWISRLSAWCE